MKKNYALQQSFTDKSHPEDHELIKDSSSLYAYQKLKEAIIDREFAGRWSLSLLIPLSGWGEGEQKLVTEISLTGEEFEEAADSGRSPFIAKLGAHPAIDSFLSRLKRKLAFIKLEQVEGHYLANDKIYRLTFIFTDRGSSINRSIMVDGGVVRIDG